MSFKNFKLVNLHKDKPYKDNPLMDKPFKDQPNQFIDLTKQDKPQLASLDYTESSNSSDQPCQQDRSYEIRDMLRTITKRFAAVTANNVSGSIHRHPKSNLKDGSHTSFGLGD